MPPIAAATAASTGLPTWLVGDWCGIEGDRRIEERWLPPTENLLLATNRTIEARRTVAFEFLRIERAADGAIAYVAQPSGGDPVRFEMVRQERNHVRFENPSHDFPQFIDYRRDASGLRATVGDQGGGTVIEFAFRTCPPDD